MISEKDIRKKIFSTFSDVAGSIGYSPLHGEIIGILLVNNRSLSLQDIAKETGYSPGMISLSLDLLEVLGVVKKMKKPGDRKLYAQLSGDLLGCLKSAVLIKVEKSIQNSLADFEDTKKQLVGLEEGEKKRILETINVLEKQIKRLDKYISLLSKTRLP
jgi:DNA-binding transcriptional regulator GbsR (MarR family)